MGKYFFVALIGALVSLGINNVVAKDNKIENAASKADLATTTKNLKTYVDKGDAASIKHTDEVMDSHLNVHVESNKRIDMIIGMVSDLYKREFNKEYVIIHQTN